jgi:hypothetical protein
MQHCDFSLFLFTRVSKLLSWKCNILSNTVLGIFKIFVAWNLWEFFLKSKLPEMQWARVYLFVVQTTGFSVHECSFVTGISSYGRLFHQNMTFANDTYDMSCLESMTFAWVGCPLYVWVSDDVIMGIPPCSFKVTSTHLDLHVMFLLFSNHKKIYCVNKL